MLAGLLVLLGLLRNISYDVYNVWPRESFGKTKHTRFKTLTFFKLNGCNMFEYYMNREWMKYTKLAPLREQENGHKKRLQPSFGKPQRYL